MYTNFKRALASVGVCTSSLHIYIACMCLATKDFSLDTTCATDPSIAQGFQVFDEILSSFSKHSVLPEGN